MREAIWHRSAHELFLNDAALKKTGIDKALIDSLPKSAQEQSSLAQGHFYEQGALAVMGRLAPEFASPESFRRGLEFTKTYYHRNGITLACEPGGLPSKAIQNAINEVYADLATPFNHCFMADGKSLAPNHPTDPAAMLKASDEPFSWGKGRTWYLPRQVKFLTDRAIYSQLMMMKDGYSDGHHGAWIMDPPMFSYAFQCYWDAGWRIHVHNNGDAGMDVLLGSQRLALELDTVTRRAIAPDMAGFGYTDRPQGIRYTLDQWVTQAVGFLGALDLERVDLIGNSFGGALSLALAIRHSGRVRRLVLRGAAGLKLDLTPGRDADWGYTPSIENMKSIMGWFAFDQSLMSDDLARLRYEASIRPGVHSHARR